MHKGDIVFIPSERLNSEREGKGLLVAHELGRTMGKLRDEYYEHSSGSLSASGGAAGNPNCLPKEMH